jgi:hypothetical protein
VNTEEKPKKKIGRPTKYTDNLADEICDAIATSSDGLRKLCANNKHWPDRDTIFRWLFNNDSFYDRYHKAKQMQITALVDDVIDISDDTSRDTKVNEEGKEVANSEYVNRSRLRVETRKWLAAKLVPRLYGERKEIGDDTQSLLKAVIDKL